jgi:hypothetical protein
MKYSLTGGYLATELKSDRFELSSGFRSALLRSNANWRQPRIVFDFNFTFRVFFLTNPFLFSTLIQVRR